MKKKIYHFGTDSSNYHYSIWMLLFYGRQLRVTESSFHWQTIRIQ